MDGELLGKEILGRRGAGAIVGALLLVLVSTGVAQGQPRRGVAVDLGRVTVRERLLPGAVYALPRLGVRNPGNVRTSYRLTVTTIAGQHLRAPQESWFRFSPRALTLGPGDSRPVEVKLAIPADAEPGTYEALVGARIAAGAGGARVGVMAAARVRFTVDSSSALDAWLRAIGTFFSDHEPWSYLLPSLAGLLALWWPLRSRFRLRLTVERRPSG